MKQAVHSLLRQKRVFFFFFSQKYFSPRNIYIYKSMYNDCCHKSVESDYEENEVSRG